MLVKHTFPGPQLHSARIALTAWKISVGIGDLAKLGWRWTFPAIQFDPVISAFCIVPSLKSHFLDSLKNPECVFRHDCLFFLNSLFPHWLSVLFSSPKSFLPNCLKSKGFNSCFFLRDLTSSHNVNFPFIRLFMPYLGILTGKSHTSLPGFRRCRRDLVRLEQEPMMVALRACRRKGHKMDFAGLFQIPRRVF